jgi:hypothetical protein
MSSVPSKYAQHAHQELMRTLSIRVRTDTSTEHARQELVSYAYGQQKRKNSTFQKFPSKYAEHARKEMRALSVGVRN